ncbi:hypothetical protein ACF0H5_005455 [Mactra antiquata]
MWCSNNTMKLTKASRPERQEKKMAIVTQFTLKDLLVQEPCIEERIVLKLPKLNVKQLHQEVSIYLRHLLLALLNLNLDL